MHHLTLNPRSLEQDKVQLLSVTLGPDPVVQARVVCGAVNLFVAPQAARVAC